jgi:biopolymer transport protein ExbB/TolQ
MSTVIVAGLAFAAVVLGLVTAILSLVNQRRAKTTAEKVQSISVQVDGRLSTLLERQSQLLDALHQSGTPVPPVPPAPGH